MSANPKLSWEQAVVAFRNLPEQRQVARDAFYDDPLLDAAIRYHASAEWKEVSKLLGGRAGRALDVGAGRGIASYALARDGFQVTALEPDPSAIVGSAAIRNLADESGLRIEVVEEVSERLPFADATFDVVFGRAVLHHMSDLDAACREMFRVLKPGGVVLAVREHVISRTSDLQTFLDQHPLHRMYGGENAFLLNRYLGALEDAGFRPVQTLFPLTSPINLFPHTLQSVRETIVLKLNRVLPIVGWRRILNSEKVLHLVLSAAQKFDHRPGRLYSFFAHKPV